MKKIVLILLLLFLFSFAGYVLTAEKIYTYNTHISAINIDKCDTCHCAIYKFLCTYDTMLEYVGETTELTKGHPLVVSGKPDSSLVIWRLEGTMPDGSIVKTMPLEEDKLSDEDLEAYRKWIEQGLIESSVAVDDTKKWGFIKSLFRDNR